jgi:AmmeMemoRadiSam system protein A
MHRIPSGRKGQQLTPYCQIARQSLHHFLTKNTSWTPSQRLGQQAGCFVSLHTFAGELRGCVGTIEPTQRDLALEIAGNAISAGTRDTRFSPVTSTELGDLSIEVSVLHPPEIIQGPDQLDPRKFGVVVEKGWKRGVLLPDLDGVDTVVQQIAIAKKKAGIDLKESIQLWRFEVEKHHE